MTVLLSRILDIYMIIIVIRVIFSWIRPKNPSYFHYFIYKTTEPVLEPIRRIIPPIGGTLDISPIIVFLLIGLLKRYLLF